jgi:copper transporter 1
MSFPHRTRSPHTGNFYGALDPRLGSLKKFMATLHTKFLYHNSSRFARRCTALYLSAFRWTPHVRQNYPTDTPSGFIARSWRVKSQAAFAGSCIGVILLVIILEFLRRAGKEYDRYIVAQHIKTLQPTVSSASSVDGPSNGKQPTTMTTTASPITFVPRFRPNVLQQAIRALLHMLQFAVAYFVMLLAMYYNGYIIICIFIGAYIGYFIFGYESFNVEQRGGDRMQENATVCCG